MNVPQAGLRARRFVTVLSPAVLAPPMDEAYFRARYDADAANVAKQTWEEYRKWVRAFYEGKTFPPVPGWAKREADILARLAPEARAKATPALQDLARRIAAEWAKDNAVRKISTADLQSWGAGFEAAAKADAGDGARILEALQEKAAEMERRGC